MNATLSALQQRLKQATSLKGVQHVFIDYLHAHQLYTFSFTYYAYHPNSVHKIKYDFASEDFIRWHQHYLEEGYEDVDSTLYEEHRQTLPTFWSLQQQLSEAKSLRERQMRLDSIAFGIEKGLSIPIHGPGDEFANLMVAQVKGSDCLEQWQFLQYELFNAAYLLYDALQTHVLNLPNTRPVTTQYNLTERELTCLTLTAKRLSIDEVAQQMNITVRTVNFHIQKFNRKLGVKSKYQAVAKALEKQLITL